MRFVKVLGVIMSKFVTTSYDIANDELMATFLGGPLVQGLRKSMPGDVLVGWGGKRNTLKTFDYAKKYDHEYLE